MSPKRGRRLELSLLVLVALWAVGQLARDATLPTAWLFYLPSIGVGLVLAAAAALQRARRRPWRRLAIASLAPIAVGLLVDHRWLAAPAAARPARASPGDSPLRLLHWNVAGGWVGAAEQAAEIAARAPDLVVLSEGPERVARGVEEALPGFRSRSFGALSVLAREPGDGAWLERRRELQAIEVPVLWRGAEVRVMVVNLASSTRVHRDPWLRRVLELAAARRPDLVVGDFNSPRRSRALSRLPDGWRHAYLEAGRGWSASFPVPLPLWSLDHVLVGPRWRALDYRLVSTRWSDHRLQWTELASLAPVAPVPPVAPLAPLAREISVAPGPAAETTERAGAALSAPSSSPGASRGTP